MESTDPDIIVLLEKIIITGLISVAILLTIFGNIFVILAWITEKALRTVPNAYIASLALADLLVGILILPLDIAIQFETEWIKKTLVCQLRQVAAVTFGIVSIFHLILIAWDRYRMVVEGVQYIQRRSIRAVVQIIFACWMVALWIALPPVLDWKRHVRSDSENDCTLNATLGWVVHSAFGSFIFPSYLMIKMYYNVYSEIGRRIQMRIEPEMGTSDTSKDIYTINYSNFNGDDDKLHYFGVEEKEAYEDNAVVTEADEAIVEAEAETPIEDVLIRDQHFSKMLGIVIGSFMICWLPFFIYHILSGLYPSIKVMKLNWYLIYLGHFNSALNPIIYTIMNQEFREKFQRMVFWKR